MLNLWTNSFKYYNNNNFLLLLSYKYSWCRVAGCRVVSNTYRNISFFLQI